LGSDDINNKLFNCKTVSNDGNSESLIVISDHFDIKEMILNENCIVVKL